MDHSLWADFAELPQDITWLVINLTLTNKNFKLLQIFMLQSTYIMNLEKKMALELNKAT